MHPQHTAPPQGSHLVDPPLHLTASTSNLSVLPPAVMEDRKPDVDIETMEGKLMPLKTYMEHKAAVETTEVYTVPVPAKKANVVVSALREALPPQNKSGIDLQHLRRLVREEFLPRHVLTRMHSTAIINALAAKVETDCAIVEVETEQTNPHPSSSVCAKSRTSSTGSSNTQRSTAPPPRKLSENASKAVSAPNNAESTSKQREGRSTSAAPANGNSEQPDVPKKKSRRRSSAEKRAIKRERERMALQRLRAVEANQNNTENAIQSASTSPVEVTSPVAALDSASSKCDGPPQNPMEPGNPAVDLLGENTPPTAASRKRRRRSSGYRRRRSRSGSSSTEGSTATNGSAANPITGSVSPKDPTPPKRVQKPNILHLLIAPTTAISLSTLYNVLRPLLFPVFPEISTIEVPLHASISQEQADEWSVTYWPAIHKRGNPFGPHPPYVDQTINRTLPRVAEYMALVKEAAKQAVACGNGIEVGAMVVDPSNEEVIAIAGDGRNMTFGGDEKERGCTWGNPLEHAIMRVVGMVAEKRKLREEFEIGTKVNVQEGVRIMRERENTLRYIPSTDIERKYFYNISPKKLASAAIFNNDSSVSASPSAEDPTVIDTEKKERDIGEYLCHNHIVYATHEPCVMCSMALIHSRIGMVVINGRHKATRAGWGGLYVGGSQYYRPAEECQRLKTRRSPQESGSESESEMSTENLTGSGYGLFWRKELNWKFLAFEWIDNNKNFGEEIEGHDFYV